MRLCDQPIIGAHTLHGLDDTLRILIETASTNAATAAFQERLHKRLRKETPKLLDIHTAIVRVSALAAPIVTPFR